jgi:hypothetical protein
LLIVNKTARFRFRAKREELEAFTGFHLKDKASIWL